MDLNARPALQTLIQTPRIEIGTADAISRLGDQELSKKVTAFHKTIPGYQKTPLVSLAALAGKAGLNKIWIKDESHRFGLNAFKVLGASYAVAKQLARKLGLADISPDFTQLKTHKRQLADLTLITATDGNHGRAVAWCANQLGCQSHILMPKGSEKARLENIQMYASHAEITQVNYDDTVAMARQLARENGWLLIQDTAWPGYTDIPNDIMRGYQTLISEFESQTDEWPTHVFLQAGVGSMAAGIAAYLIEHPNPTPKLIILEPENADCFYQSIAADTGQPLRVNGELETIMAGLACGEPSMTAWPILSQSASAFIRCNDACSVDGMRRLAHPLADDPAVVAGESAAVGLGVLMAMVNCSELSANAAFLELNGQSRVLILSTEGDTNPEFYRKVVTKKAGEKA